MGAPQVGQRLLPAARQVAQRGGALTLSHAALALPLVGWQCAKTLPASPATRRNLPAGAISLNTGARTQATMPVRSPASQLA